MLVSTKVTVRALALGGKFIGQHVGFAAIDIYGPEDPCQPLASGLTDQGLVANTDGSGVVALIMGQPYPWGYPVRADQSTEFTVEIPLDRPTVIHFVATSVADPRISASCHRLIVPGVPMTGAMAVIIVLTGLLTVLTEPGTADSIVQGSATTITAQVRMMCGCLIENLFWPVANFSVLAIVTHAGQSAALPLTYRGTPSLFSATYNFPCRGEYEIVIIATEMNGNTGSTVPAIVTVQAD